MIIGHQNIDACRQNAALKIHPKDILRDINHLYGIIPVHLASNVVFTSKDIQMAEY